MKARHFIFLMAFCSVYTESWALPEVIDNSAYPASAPRAATSKLPSSTNTMLEMMGRLDQLQAEVQQLNGKVEEQANLITELKKQQSTMYSDFDERMQSIESKTAAPDQAVPETPVEPTASTDAETASSASEAEAPASAPAPEATPVPAENKDQVSTSADAAPAEAAPAAAPKPEVVQASDGEKQEYQQAYNSLRNGHTDQSITELTAYLDKYPAGGLASNAQYWLGEAYRVKQDNDLARKAFNDVIEKYQGSAKVPDALLKLGYIEMELKNTAKAREYLTRVTSDFPNTPAAHLAAKKLSLLDAAQN